MIYLFPIFLFFVPRALAAIATCKPGWEWANNTKRQNPCELASMLEGHCEGNAGFELGPLKPGSNYGTPQNYDQLGQQCNCNIVIYSLYMACTACQNVTIQSWAYWSQFCDQIYLNQYPGTIPSNTPVPHWAFLNYTAEGKFDSAIAKSAGGLPEAIGSVPPLVPISSTSSSSRSSSSTSTRSSSPTSTRVNPTGQGGNNQTKSSRTGAIVGGVVGGLAALAAIVVGTWIFLRKRAATRRDQGPSEDIGVYTDAPVSERETQPLRPYDPSDPSTYPTTVDYGPVGRYTDAVNNAHYPGVPEL